MLRRDQKWRTIRVTEISEVPFYDRGEKVRSELTVRRPRRRGRKTRTNAVNFIGRILRYKLIGRHSVREIVFALALHSAVAALLIAIPTNDLLKAMPWIAVAYLTRR